MKKATDAQVAVGYATELSCVDVLLKDGESIQFGDETLFALSTAGHTDGCTSYRWRDRLFTGDALLINACGRTDFQQGNPHTLYHSLLKLLAYDGDFLVYPAHDYNGRRVSSLVEEKNNNPYLQLNEADFVEKMNNLDLPKPQKIDIAVPSNMQCGYFKT